MDWNVKPETIKLLLENISSKLCHQSRWWFLYLTPKSKGNKTKGQQVGLHQTKRLLCCTMLSHFSRVWLFATLWTVAFQSPLSQGFSGQESLGCHTFLQGIFLTQRLNPHLLQLLCCRRILHLWATREQKSKLKKKIKMQHNEWEKIFAIHISNKELMSKTYKELIQLNSKKQAIHFRIWIDIFPKAWRWSISTWNDA